MQRDPRQFLNISLLLSAKAGASLFQPGDMICYLSKKKKKLTRIAVDKCNIKLKNSVKKKIPTTIIIIMVNHKLI